MKSHYNCINLVGLFVGINVFVGFVDGYVVVGDKVVGVYDTDRIAEEGIPGINNCGFVGYLTAGGDCISFSSSLPLIISSSFDGVICHIIIDISITINKHSKNNQPVYRLFLLYVLSLLLSPLDAVWNDSSSSSSS